ncbi:hypothetical protein AB1Y20_002768 [Prymnesium parvum]|uniref:Uncharacterized protein n=1 Tax=Prymnesium parvum TaxID=97485 RepID=A0AB34JBB9_PRYPA
MSSAAHLAVEGSYIVGESRFCSACAALFDARHPTLFLTHKQSCLAMLPLQYAPPPYSTCAVYAQHSTRTRAEPPEMVSSTLCYSEHGFLVRVCVFCARHFEPYDIASFAQHSCGRGRPPKKGGVRGAAGDDKTASRATPKAGAGRGRGEGGRAKPRTRRLPAVGAAFGATSGKPPHRNGASHPDASEEEVVAWLAAAIPELRVTAASAPPAHVGAKKVEDARKWLPVEWGAEQIKFARTHCNTQGVRLGVAWIRVIDEAEKKERRMRAFIQQPALAGLTADEPPLQARADELPPAPSASTSASPADASSCSSCTPPPAATPPPTAAPDDAASSSSARHSTWAAVLQSTPAIHCEQQARAEDGARATAAHMANEMEEQSSAAEGGGDDARPASESGERRRSLSQCPRSHAGSTHRRLGS